MIDISDEFRVSSCMVKKSSVAKKNTNRNFVRYKYFRFRTVSLLNSSWPNNDRSWKEMISALSNGFEKNISVLYNNIQLMLAEQFFRSLEETEIINETNVHIRVRKCRHSKMFPYDFIVAVYSEMSLNFGKITPVNERASLHFKG